MIRKIGIAVLIVLVIVGALAGLKVMQIKTLIAAGKSFAPPPESISSFVAREEKWETALSAIGTVTAVEGVTIAPELAGKVAEIAFESGAVVAKGDLLIRLDTSSEEAQLRAIESQVELARINLDRSRKLRSDSTVSQADLDAAEATMKETQANADNIRATINKKTLRAPFAGRLGIRLINLGQYLDTGKPVVSLQSLTPIHTDFSLPQQELSHLTNGLRVRLTIDAFPSRPFEGTLTAINPDLDQSTRSVGLQATLTNADQLLRPGMFARVEVILPEEKNVLVIPGTAVLSAPFGDSVYVIESGAQNSKGPGGLTVRQQFVRTGRSQGDFLTIESGLKTGDRVVSAGAFKLRNGMAVLENNEIVPKTSDKPRPSDS